MRKTSDSADFVKQGAEEVFAGRSNHELPDGIKKTFTVF